MAAPRRIFLGERNGAKEAAVETASQVRVQAQGTGREIWLAGAGAGALAGLAMMAFMMGAAALDGAGALDPLRAVGTAFRGEDASRIGIGAVAWGIVVFLGVGAALSIAFTAIVPRDMPLSSSVVLGAGCATFWMALAVKVLIPWLAPVLALEMPRHGGAWVIAHAVFGAVAGIAPWLRRRVGQGAAHRPEGRTGVLRPRTSP